ncbi:regulation of enolase protein 1 (concanavalin A-like superfamily) [Kibdelosporangium banguiense]|uniref:Regulation of enolase protein 1 (Concanavalin A-like superfamily) n=1 Tax=Kibdelosporangium banguiense TaxID=1365924 RepID=A0ABS4TYX9_9PSEU|nr:regulation of enolase protein 1 (concanavalin A-like superfamily) [Kibdelosporangium banguiense]
MAAFEELYDQAGLFIRVDPRTWLKAGIEQTDGAPHLGAVVTHGQSDWSLAPVQDWAGRPVTVRASRTGDAVTIRARVAREPWRTIRLTPLAPDAVATAGRFACSPQRAGLPCASPASPSARPTRPYTPNHWSASSSIVDACGAGMARRYQGRLHCWWISV